MKCKEFPLLMSAQVDGYATEREQAKLQRHLHACAACRRAAAGLRSLRTGLQTLEMPQPVASPDLTLQIQAALQSETRLRGNPARRRQDLIELWRMRLFSQSIGAVVSLILFVFVVLGVFKPAYRTLLAAVKTPDVIEEYYIDPAIRYRVLISPPPPPPPFSPHEALLELGQSLPEDAQIIARVKVNGRDGRAKLDHVVAQSDANQPGDPQLINKLSTVLYQRASFQPPRHHYISRDAVIVFGKVNISAHLD